MREPFQWLARPRLMPTGRVERVVLVFVEGEVMVREVSLPRRKVLEVGRGRESSRVPDWEVGPLAERMVAVVVVGVVVEAVVVVVVVVVVAAVVVDLVVEEVVEVEVEEAIGGLLLLRLHLMHLPVLQQARRMLESLVRTTGVVEGVATEVFILMLGDKCGTHCSLGSLAEELLESIF